VHADNEHADLFFGFPNSYGTLGYALRVKAQHVPVKKYVHLAHLAVQSGDNSSRRWRAAARGRRRLRRRHGVLAGRDVPHARRFTDTAPWTQRLHLRAHLLPLDPRKRTRTTSRAHDYIWRWDTDWFWCSKNVLAQNPLCASSTAGSGWARARTRRSCAGTAASASRRRSSSVLGLHSESVIQDVDIPLGARAGVPDFYARENRAVADVDLPDRPQARRDASRSIRCATSGT
jgi:hypothetical protein